VTYVYLIVGLMFGFAAVLALYRIVVGPSILDRMIASDMLLTTLILVVGAEMVYNGHTRTIPVMLVLASTAVFATVSVARYVSKQDRTTDTVGTDPLAPPTFTDPLSDGEPLPAVSKDNGGQS